MSPDVRIPSSPIAWDFTVAEQGHVARYGHKGADFYKQFMPYGLEISEAHPPQRILQRTYEMAKRFAAKPSRSPFGS